MNEKYITPDLSLAKKVTPENSSSMSLQCHHSVVLVLKSTNKFPPCPTRVTHYFTELSAFLEVWKRVS